MQNGPEQRPPDDAPLYVRWKPERAEFAIELRLDLVPVIGKELARADNLSMEIGGVLLGTLPSPFSPTLRIEEVALVARGLDEGTVYVLSPGQHSSISEIRLRAQGRHREAVGFFRSHLRPGALRPSLADRSLLSGEFPNSLYAVLLIEGREPRNAAFFLGNHGNLPGEPAVKSFRFDEKEFRALPEVAPDPVENEEPDKGGQEKSGTAVYWRVAALLAIAVVACVLMWIFAGQKLSLSPILNPSAQVRRALSVSIAESGGVLRITWDHTAPELDHASGAKLFIVDGGSRRELQLGLDELRLGAVEYQKSSPAVDVTITVTPGVGSDRAAPMNQTIHWGQP